MVASTPLAALILIMASHGASPTRVVQRGRVINEVSGINRVVLDISSMPRAPSSGMTQLRRTFWMVWGLGSGSTSDGSNRWPQHATRDADGAGRTTTTSLRG